MNTLRLVGILLVLSVSGDAHGAPGTDKPPSDKVRKLQQERVKALEEVSESIMERVKIGKDSLHALITLLSELTEARLEVADTEADAIKALTTSLELHRKIEEQLQEMYEAGLETKVGVRQIRAARLKVEIQLEKRKAR